MKPAIANRKSNIQNSKGIIDIRDPQITFYPSQFTNPESTIGNRKSSIDNAPGTSPSALTLAGGAT